MGKKLGIIGGKGKMGALFKGLLQDAVDEILISDKGTELTNNELVKACNIIIVSTPITKTVDVVEEISDDLTKDQLLIDLTSLKTGPTDAMMHSKASVIGLHPLFGPSVTELKNQRIVMCPQRPGDWQPWLTEILEKKGAKIIQITHTMHDQMIALIQSLVHFTSMMFTHTLFGEIDDPKETLKLATPVYRMQLYIAGRVFAQSGELYADIQMENPLFPDILEHFEKAFTNLKEIILAKDKEAFLEEFNSLARLLGPITKEGQELTNEFIRVMAEKEESC